MAAIESSPHGIDYHSVTQRFSILDPEQVAGALAHLSEHGYCVWADVASPEETASAEDLFWSWAESTFAEQSVRRDDVDSWAHLPIMAGTGALWAGGIGTSAFNWHIRSLPNLKAVFKHIWDGEQNLIASLDGAGCLRPTQTVAVGGTVQFRPDWVTRRTSFHVDQNPVIKPGKECVQGLWSMYDQDHTTGGLVVVPGSHRTFPQLASLLKTGATNDFINVPFGHSSIDPAAGAQQPKLIQCRAGDLITWESRVTHFPSPALSDLVWLANEEANAAASPAAPVAQSELEAVSMSAPSAAAAASMTTLAPSAAASSSSSASSASLRPRLQRLVSYQCMTPFSKVDPSSYDEFVAGRLGVVARGETLASHWPHSFVKDKVKKRGACAPHTPVELTREQRALVIGADLTAA